jgi:hypothetical protein
MRSVLVADGVAENVFPLIDKDDDDDDELADGGGRGGRVEGERKGGVVNELKGRKEREEEGEGKGKKDGDGTCQWW